MINHVDHETNYPTIQVCCLEDFLRYLRRAKAGCIVRYRVPNEQMVSRGKALALLHLYLPPICHPLYYWTRYHWPSDNEISSRQGHVFRLCTFKF